MATQIPQPEHYSFRFKPPYGRGELIDVGDVIEQRGPRIGTRHWLVVGAWIPRTIQHVECVRYVLRPGEASADWLITR